MSHSPRILFACGGTGGHVYPALAIADAVRTRNEQAAIAFAGTRDHLEWKAVPRAGYAIHPITVSGLHRELSMRTLRFPFKLARGLIQSHRLVGDFDPDVVVGTGGYVAGPVLWAASLRGRPTIVQEQNAYAGLTNRLLARRARRIHIAFPEARDYLPPGRCVLSGNPTREELRRADRLEAREALGIPRDALLLFVFGGSLGSHAINAAIEKRWEAWRAVDGLHLLWQTGEQYYEDIDRRTPNVDQVKLEPYVERMDLAYAAADLVVSRAGAITCSELMVTGTPSILVPSPNVAEDHQTKNAKSMADHGAALLLPESQLEARIPGHVRALLQDNARRKAMSNAARALARPEAADVIAQDVLTLAGSPDHSTTNPS